MLSALGKLVGLTVMIVALGAGVWWINRTDSAQQRIVELEQRNEMLETFVERLAGDRRIAELLVLSTEVRDGQTHRSLFFIEYDRAGNELPPRQFEVIGEHTHIDAMVIQFERGYVAEGDALRGKSIALFTRIFGDAQPAADAPRIDQPGRIPDLYRSTDPKQAAFEQELWNDFWQLADGSSLAASKGVRVAFGQSVWGPLAEDKLYTIELDNAGGLTMKSQPLKPIYREAIRRAAGKS